jgi:small subunit ribosomal protein S3
MAVERKFISEGVRRVRVEKYLTKELKRAGFGGMDIARTPLGTQVTIFAEKPGIVIGKGGKVIRQLTLDLAANYGVDTPQVDVQQVPNPNFNAQIMAERLANAIERGWYFRKAGSSIMRRVMDAGALGCEVIIAIKKLGVIGVQVKIVPPDAKLPDSFIILKKAEEPVPKVSVTEVGEEMEPEPAPEAPDALDRIAEGS